MKPVIILSEDLPTGLKANFAAVLAMSLGRAHPDLIGSPTPAADGIVLPGITTVPMPVLAAPGAEMPALFERAVELPFRLAYMRAALETRNYEDYAARIAAVPLSGHEPMALLLAGPRKAVDRICGRLPLLR